jgi:amidophosphoribosyltransferase
MGHVADIFTPERIGHLNGSMAIGHTRYSTSGDTILLNAQPFSVACNKGQIALAHNGNITNSTELRNDLEAAGSIFQATSDTEVILHLVARSREQEIEAALREALLQVEGAYSLVCVSENKIIVARDPYGFRPLAMGTVELTGRKFGYVFASETCAFDLIGATYIRDVEPGEMVIVSNEGLHRMQFTPPRKRSQCVFEHVYFSRPDSLVFGRPVQQSREEMGRQLAREYPIDADLVVPVPDSGVTAAIGYAAESGIPYRQALIRNHYVGRTFIQPTQSVRELGVRMKHAPNRAAIEGKRIILIDDSLVRGTTSKKIVRMMRDAGAKEVHFRLASPPIIHPDYYGIDLPDRGGLLAATHTLEEMRDIIGADSLAFLSIDGMYRAVGEPGRDPANPKFSDHCFTGDYPTHLTDQTQVEQPQHQLSLLAEAS